VILSIEVVRCFRSRKNQTVRERWNNSVCTEDFVWHALEYDIIRRDADTSIARPTSRCRRTESIVPLERGVCSCAELQVFSCYGGWKEACQATRAISTTSKRELSSRFFFLQGKAPKEIHVILTETLGEHAPSYATVKNCLTQFKLGDFSTCDAPRQGRPKTVTTAEILIKCTS